MQHVLRVNGGLAWRVALVLAALLAALLVFRALGGQTGAEVSLAILLAALFVVWPRPRAEPKASGKVERIGALEDELSHSRSAIAYLSAERERLTAALRDSQARLAGLENESSGRAEAERRLARTEGQLREPERSAGAERERPEQAARAGARAVVEREQALKGEIETRTGAEEQPAVLVSAHLLFLPTPGGYRLVSREGPTPGLGSEIKLPQLDGGGFVVSKLGPSPLPSDPRRCAYLARPA